MCPELRLVPFVCIRTTWSDDVVRKSGHVEEWLAEWVLLTYGDAALWTVGQVRPVRAILFDRVWTLDAPGLVQ